MRERLTVVPGAAHRLPFELTRAGQTMLEVEAAAVPGEVTALRRPASVLRATACATACACSRRASLTRGCASGATCSRPIRRSISCTSPSCGRRKSRRRADPRTGADRVSLTRAVRGQAVHEFDLVIFNRCSRRGTAARLSRRRRPLCRGGRSAPRGGSRVRAPAQPVRIPRGRRAAGRPVRRGVRAPLAPALTRNQGRGRPVAGGLEAAWSDGDGATERTAWGRWFRHINVEVWRDWQVLMSGASERPLLVLQRVGKGRSGAAPVGSRLAVGARLRDRWAAGLLSRPRALADADQSWRRRRCAPVPRAKRSRSSVARSRTWSVD